MRGPTRLNPIRPDPITHLRSLYLWNGLTDSREVFFVRCHHSINFIFDRHRYPPVPATARGTCRGEGVGDTLSIGTSTTAGPIVFKFCVCLETSYSYYFYTSQRWGESASPHVHTRLPYLANGWADCVQILCVTRDPLNKCFTQCLRWKCICTCARAHPFARSRKRLGGLCSNLVCG